MVQQWINLLCVVGSGTACVVLFKDFIGGKRYEGNVNLSGKTVIVTGANSGIGLETCRNFAKKGARVIMACRDMKLCERARTSIMTDTNNSDVACRVCDLACLSSIRNFANTIKKEEPAVHILVNNAGVMRCPKTLTLDGFEMQFGVNHLGHFLLTNLLLEKLIASAPSRVINVSSIAHKRGKINFDDLNGDQSYDPASAYNQSKLANVLFTRELARKLAGTGVTTYAVHPGIVDTNIMRHMGIANSTTAMILVRPFLWLFLRTARDGAQKVIHCALSDEVSKQSGLYYSNCEEMPPAEQALDDSVATRLWAVSEKWTRLK